MLFSRAAVTLGPPAEPWTAQLRAELPLEAADPLCGVDVLGEIRGRAFDRHRRWLWPVAPGQTHLMESIRIGPSGGNSGDNPN